MSDIKVERRSDAVAVVTIDRPERRNALNQPAWRDLGRAFTSLDDDALRAIILTGAGGAFCAGDDILAFASVRDDAAARTAYWNTIMECYAAVSRARVPVVAAVSGPCAGGGCTLALRADFRIADRSGRFSVPPARLGLVYPMDSTQLLVATAGINMAKRMLYTGEFVGAEMAHACGLVTELVDGDVVEAALAFVEPITRNAPISLAASKLACDAVMTGRAAELAPRVAELSQIADASEDYREGTRAFAEKRKPVFMGR
jgi:enoyl-CoA hydratase